MGMQCYTTREHGDNQDIHAIYIRSTREQGDNQDIHAIYIRSTRERGGQSRSHVHSIYSIWLLLTPACNIMDKKSVQRRHTCIMHIFVAVIFDTILAEYITHTSMTATCL